MWQILINNYCGYSTLFERYVLQNIKIIFLRDKGILEYVGMILCDVFIIHVLFWFDRLFQIRHFRNSRVEFKIHAWFCSRAENILVYAADNVDISQELFGNEFLHLDAFLMIYPTLIRSMLLALKLHVLEHSIYVI